MTPKQSFIFVIIIEKEQEKWMPYKKIMWIIGFVFGRVCKVIVKGAYIGYEEKEQEKWAVSTNATMRRTATGSNLESNK
jgi:hypothetical protein